MADNVPPAAGGGAGGAAGLPDTGAEQDKMSAVFAKAADDMLKNTEISTQGNTDLAIVKNKPNV